MLEGLLSFALKLAYLALPFALPGDRRLGPWLSSLIFEKHLQVVLFLLPRREPLPGCPFSSSVSFVHVEAVQWCNCPCCRAPKRSQFWAAVVWGRSELHTGRRCPPGFTCWLSYCCFVHSFLFLDTGFLFIIIIFNSSECWAYILKELLMYLE